MDLTRNAVGWMNKSSNEGINNLKLCTAEKGSHQHVVEVKRDVNGMLE